MQASWQPACNREMLAARAELYRCIRAYMSAQQILEVETPALGRHAGTDPQIQPLKTGLVTPAGGKTESLYLHTSPEFCMKRLLAADSGPIYQICKVYRDAETGTIHQPEFTMLEWYRPGFDHHALMDDVERLLRSLGFPAAGRFRYGSVFSRTTGLDPHRCTVQDLQTQCQAAGYTGQGDDRPVLLDFLFSTQVVPGLGGNGNRPVLIYDYPACQAALARISSTEPAVAERFELFISGMEIANGFHELADASQQLERFQQENNNRKQTGMEEIPIDTRLLAALEHGLPDCAGVAVGLDRLLMVLTGSRIISDVLTFTVPS